jgi:hypothetical protein
MSKCAIVVTLIFGTEFKRAGSLRNSLIDRDAIFTMLVVPTAFAGWLPLFDHSAMA